MKMNYTKVQPTVVKHVLPNHVMSVYDPASHGQGVPQLSDRGFSIGGHSVAASENNNFGATQMFGSTSGVPQAKDLSKNLINQLQAGMADLSHLQKGMFSENSNPNLQLAALESLNKLR